MKNNIVKIIMWILFWYYLIPYYLLKKFVFKKVVYSTIWSSCATIGIFLLLSIPLSGANNTKNNPDQETAVATSTKMVHKTITKKVGTSSLNKEKARAKVLKQEEKNKQAEYNKLKEQLDNYHEKEEKQKRQAEKEQKAAEEQAKKEAATKEKEAEEAQKQAAKNESHDTSSNQGDLYTANQGTIVGNRNSMIYHVPGQAGYHMNSANAVYFNSEQDAIKAGYRKAKR